MSTFDYRETIADIAQATFWLERAIKRATAHDDGARLLAQLAIAKRACVNVIQISASDMAVDAGLNHPDHEASMVPPELR